MTGLTIGSLFSGYGGLDRAAERVFGARTVWVSDIDKGACKVLAHRYPHAPNLGDITRVDWATVEPVDIITGGSPCQDLSHAGRRAGMTEGTRSNLWASMREAIATIRPRLVVWENVQGALSADATSALEFCPGCMGDPRHGGPVLRALGRVLGDLADLGFDAEWHGLRVSDLGGCHGRWRVFVMAWPADSDLTGLQGLADSLGASPAERHGHAVAGTGRPDLTLLPTPAASSPNDGESVETWEARRQRTKERVGNGNGFGTPLSIAVQLLPTPRSSDTNGVGQHGTGGADLRTTVALLPTPRATDGTKGGPNQRGSSGDLMLPSAVVQLLPTPQASDATAGGEDVALRAKRGFGERLVDTAYGNRWADYAAAIARHEQAWGVPAPEPTELGPKGNPRLSARFTEWMMMQPAGWITDVPGVTRNESLKLCGNGVVTPQAVHALRVMLDRIGAACHAIDGGES